VALQFVTDLAAELQEREMSPEVARLGRTIKRWRTQIAAWHACKLSNGPTDGANCMIKRVKRTGCGFKNFNHYRSASCSTPASSTGTSSPPSPR